jgi:hypothetical protein
VLGGDIGAILVHDALGGDKVRADALAIVRLHGWVRVVAERVERARDLGLDVHDFSLRAAHEWNGESRVSLVSLVSSSTALVDRERRARTARTCFALRKVMSFVVSAASVADFVNASQKLMRADREFFKGEREARCEASTLSFLLNNTI